ncbi:MAG: hypothetical protein JWQ10_4229 [Herbaspirillum sp.]|nr:hypothetical protein [Herbaspirillum sp.]
MNAEIRAEISAETSEEISGEANKEVSKEVSGEVNAEVSAEMNKSGEHGKHWATSDIEGLQLHLPEVDPEKYYDRRENEALRIAMVAWPVLAQLMGLSIRDD